VFLIWDENNVDNILMLLAVARQVMDFSASRAAECMGSWEGTQLGQLTRTGHGIFHTIRCHAQHIQWGKEGRGRHLECWCLSSQVTVTCDVALLSW